MSACPVCNRDLLPQGGRCPFCGADRAEAGVTANKRCSPRGPARLLLLGAAPPAEFGLAGSDVLGRSMQATVRITDREVSRKHSQIDRDGHDYVLRDLGSSNGTFVNGQRILGPMRLKDGDEVLIGASRLKFHLGNGAGRESAEIVHMEPSG